MEMTWWLKHLLDKCEDLGLTPQEPHKKPLTEKKNAWVIVGIGIC